MLYISKKAEIKMWIYPKNVEYIHNIYNIYKRFEYIGRRLDASKRNWKYQKRLNISKKKLDI